MDEWGIPDWRDPAAYGDTSGWGVMRWRWEFYRRRDDLRAAFDASAERTYQENCKAARGERVSRPDEPDFMPVSAIYPKGSRVSRPDEPGFVAFCNWATVEKLGYDGIPNPRISNQPEWAITPAYAIHHTSIFNGLTYSRVAVREGQVAVVFDLSLPIKPQLEDAKRVLQQFGGKSAKPNRRQMAKWPDYLRALDARSAGASWAEIAAIFPHVRDQPQAGRDIWEQANALRNNFGALFRNS
jgi:hypothetical protein